MLLISQVIFKTLVFAGILGMIIDIFLQNIS